MCVNPTAHAIHEGLALDARSAYGEFLDELVAHGLLVPSGVPGVYGRGRDLERVIEAFDGLAGRAAAELPLETLRFPPIFSRRDYEKIDHIRNFPDLMGSVHTFRGGDAEQRAMLGRFEQGNEWSRDLAASEVMLTPAICYPLYPTAEGVLPEGGRRVDLQGYAFRHEPSEDPARMQIFRMHEVVRLGTPREALEHREHWRVRGSELLRSVGLEVETVPANDPFFGRGGKVQKALQREQELKYEFVAPICSREKPTAIGSCNYHLDHFGAAFGIRTADGAVAHSACVGFGLERVALALLRRHGLRPGEWPREVRDVLALD